MAVFIMQARSSGGGGDGLLKIWNVQNAPDWAAVLFPGPGTAADVAVLSGPPTGTAGMNLGLVHAIARGNFSP